MSEEKNDPFTPGEWRAFVGQFDSITNCVTAPVGWIAAISGNENNYIPKEQRDANTYLFAASKDLLFAAEKVLADLNARIEDAAHNQRPVPFFDGIGELHDAIQKARAY